MFTGFDPQFPDPVCKQAAIRGTTPRVSADLGYGVRFGCSPITYMVNSGTSRVRFESVLVIINLGRLGPI